MTDTIQPPAKPEVRVIPAGRSRGYLRLFLLGDLEELARWPRVYEVSKGAVNRAKSGRKNDLQA